MLQASLCRLSSAVTLPLVYSVSSGMQLSSDALLALLTQGDSGESLDLNRGNRATSRSAEGAAPDTNRRSARKPTHTPAPAGPGARGTKRAGAAMLRSPEGVPLRLASGFMDIHSQLSCPAISRQEGRAGHALHVKAEAISEK